jgi:hypothetical protein
VLFAKPLAAAIFLTINGGILLGGEVLRHRHLRQPAAVSDQRARQDERSDQDTMLGGAAEQRLADAGVGNELWTGASQISRIICCSQTPISCTRPIPSAVLSRTPSGGTSC